MKRVLFAALAAAALALPAQATTYQVDAYDDGGAPACCMCLDRSNSPANGRI
jgi:hypothetical protein